MMKGILKKSLVLLALGVLIVGCATPSEENSISSRDGKSINGVPMVMDPANQTLEIGDGAGSVIFATADGHTVEVANGTSTAVQCLPDGSGVNSSCFVRLYNRDSDEYMANAFVAIFRCDSCELGDDHKVDNFDAEHILEGSTCWTANGPKAIPGCTLHVPTVPGGASLLTAAVGGAGIAYVSDTYNPEIASFPHNAFGAPLMDLPTTPNGKPAWMIAPKCGYAVTAWDFGGANLAQYPFWATVKASWFPMVPAADPRYNFYWFDTIYLTLTDLVAPASDSAWRKAYRPGSIYRSNVLAGYKPSWARGTSGVSMADINFTGGQKYFAVNVGLESSDRMENENFGLQSDPYFEYYSKLAVLVSYNPRVISEMRLAPDTWYLTKTLATGGTRFQHKATVQCVATADCENFGTDHAVDMRLKTNLTATGGGLVNRGGYIGTTNNNLVFDNAGNWSYFSTAEYYTYYNFGTETTTQIGGMGNVGWRAIPKKFFQRGYAKIRCMDANNATCITQDRADADPEIWLYSFVMKVQGTCPGVSCNVGLGSEIKLDSFSGFTLFEFNRTNSGFNTDPLNDADPKATNAGPMTADDTQAFQVYDGATLIIGAAADHLQPNMKIRHRGPAKTGTYQGWNVGVCIK